MWGRKKDAEGDVTRRNYEWGMKGLECRGVEVQERLVERLDLGGCQGEYFLGGSVTKSRCLRINGGKRKWVGPL